MRGQPGFWDLDERYERLSAVGDPLEKLNGIIPWPVFEKPLAKALKRSDGSKGGRPPFPAVLMFKILMLQALYNLCDDQAEFVIQDRLSFMSHPVRQGGRRAVTGWQVCRSDGSRASRGHHRCPGSLAGSI